MPTRLSCRFRLSVLLLTITLLSSCGSGGPTIPEGPRERTFTGRLSVPTADSLGGLFHLTAIVNSQFTAAQPETHPVLAVVRRWLVTPLIAQETSGSATGNLITNTGELVPLTGTYAGGSFSVTGGGYAIAAQANATGSLSGSGRAPGGGSGSVTALPTPSTAPPSSQSTGTYVGTFEMTTAIRSRNWNHSGVLIGTCLHPLRFSGNVTMHVSRIGDTNQMTGHLRIEWSEVAAGGSTCPPNAFPNRLNEWKMHGQGRERCAGRRVIDSLKGVKGRRG